MQYEIDFINYFNDEEKTKVIKYIEKNFNELELHAGGNYSVDVSDAVKRTASVDIYVNEGECDK